MKGCVRWVLCPPPFLPPHRALRSSLGWDSALDRLTTYLSLPRGRCSPSYGNAAACDLWTWKRWAQGGPQTTCSGSFTLGTGMSTVSVPHFCGGEKDAEGGRGAQHHPGRAAGQAKTSGSVLNFSLDLFPANHPPKTPYLITPRLLA